ncbi:DNA polymerase III subunit gamma/tau [Candidatus Gottesmanbacteria bacterium]|nr:DNA polymerase III subunit gamma/tau [Candidatus Gottesmanbacteria bacterium]
MVLYRKYRPQKISELDNAEIRERLTRVFSSSFIPHALLFAGPKGTGKTSAARIIAKVLNCEKRNSGSDLKRAKGLTLADIEPCNLCETCKAITEGRHLDIIEIDAASNRGIEEIRDLREKIKFAPVSAIYKVYIIDEVHMLTNEAFNALLKTLEEPPAHAVFILATTEPEKLPETIVSRCIRFNFKKASPSEILGCLERVVKGEKVNVTPDVLQLIAQTSDGSFRDATKILEQAILENALTSEKLNILLGRQNLSVINFLKLLASRDTGKVLFEIVKMGENGINFRFLTEELLYLLHVIPHAQHGIGKEKISADLVTLLTKDEISRLIKLFSKVYVDLKTTSIPQLPLEVAVVEWCERKQ